MVFGIGKKKKKGTVVKGGGNTELEVQEVCFNMLLESYGTKLTLFDEPTEDQTVDRIAGPLKLDWRQDQRLSSIKRDFYCAMFYGEKKITEKKSEEKKTDDKKADDKQADDKKADNKEAKTERQSIPIFFAGGEKGLERGQKDGLGVPRRFACDIPKTLTFEKKDEDGKVSVSSEPPEELNEHWKDYHVKMGFASFEKNSAFMYLVVIPDQYKPFQHRFSEFIDDHDTFYGLTSGSGEETVSQGVNFAFTTTASSNVIKAGLAALGVATTSTPVGIVAVAACAAVNFVVVNGIKGCAGNYLRYVTTPPKHVRDAKAKSFDLDEDYYSEMEGSEDSEEEYEERFEELEDQVERMDMALARLEQEVKGNRLPNRGRYSQNRNSTRRRRSGSSRSRSPARASSAEHYWC